MATIRILLEVLVATLAVIGAYGLIREAMLSAVASRQVTMAVVLREAVDEITLDILLDEAMRHPNRRQGRRIVLLVARSLLEGDMGEGGRLAPDFLAVADRYHAVVAVADLQYT